MSKSQQTPRRPGPGSLSDEEIQRRWKKLTPMFVIGLVVCAAAVAGIFLANRWGHWDQRVTDILNVTFQIVAAAAGLFGFLTLMALLFGRHKPHS